MFQASSIRSALQHRPQELLWLLKADDQTVNLIAKAVPPDGVQSSSYVRGQICRMLGWQESCREAVIRAQRPVNAQVWW